MLKEETEAFQSSLDSSLEFHKRIIFVTFTKNLLYNYNSLSHCTGFLSVVSEYFDLWEGTVGSEFGIKLGLDMRQKVDLL